MERPTLPSELIVQFGGSYARELGIDLSRSDSMEIQKWFLAALLFGARISVKTAVKTYLEFQRAGLVQPEKVLNAGWNELVRVLGRGGYTRYDFKTATKLLEVANSLLRDYSGDLNALHHDAADEADLERRIRQLGRGIGDVTINIFLREMRGIWTKAQPLPSERTVQAAKALGLVDVNLCARIGILQVLKAVARADGIKSEDFPEFEAALVRFGTIMRKKRMPRSP
jgi:hypothetical protein